MRIGLFGGASAAHGQSNDSNQTYHEFVAYVQEAEKLGFHGVFLVEHHFTGFGQVSASLNLLTYLAAKTSTIRLGTAVVVLPWHHPVLLAEQIATIDLLSNGRVDFGVGKGYRANEFEGFCIPQEEATDKFEETLTFLRRAWSSSERFSHESKRWHFKNIIVEPPTVQQPHPPLWLGASSEQSVRRAAKDGFNLLLDQFGSFELTGQRISAYADECAKAGRKFSATQVGVTRPLIFADSPEERRAAISRYADGIRAIEKLAKGGAEKKSVGDLITFNDPTDAIEGGALIGNTEEMISRLKQLQANGVEYVLLINASLSTSALRQFANEVMPAFAKRSDAA